MCRIVPPLSWKPPCPLKNKHIWEDCKFATRIQRIDKLQNRYSMRKMSKLHNNVRKKKRRCRMGVDAGTADAGLYEAEWFGFEPGPEFTLETFETYAVDFKSQYFSRTRSDGDSRSNVTMLREQLEPSMENIEGEYWRMVEKPTDEIEVSWIWEDEQ